MLDHPRSSGTLAGRAHPEWIGTTQAAGVGFQKRIQREKRGGN
jgi:hypothetical protein